LRDLREGVRGTDSSEENGRVGDVLDLIGETLEWYGSADSQTWRAAVFPELSLLDQDVARQLSADTGMDGYAAWAAVADVRDHSGGPARSRLLRSYFRGGRVPDDPL
jgi:hypothetical protein